MFFDLGKFDGERPPLEGRSFLTSDDNTPKYTPVQKVGDYYVKRDDLFKIAGVVGGKVRTCWHLCQGAKGVVTAGSRSSPQVNIVAQIAKRLSIPAHCVTPKGDLSPELLAAKEAGAKILQREGGFNNVIVSSATQEAHATGYREIPFGMECMEAIRQTAYQVGNIPEEITRIVVPVGSAMSLAGISRGLETYKRSIKLVGVCVGADPTSRLDKFAPPGWRNNITFRYVDTSYDRPVKASLGGIELDAIYEAKCLPFLEPGDLFWIVGIRQTHSQTVYKVKKPKAKRISKNLQINNEATDYPDIGKLTSIHHPNTFVYPKLNTLLEPWTYGLEVEAIDFDWSKDVCPETGYITTELDIVNSNGQAFNMGDTCGGEFNTHPTTTIEDQLRAVFEFKEMYPEAKVNHRIKLQPHIRVPGLINDVEGLQRILCYSQRYTPLFYDAHFNFYHHPDIKSAGRDGSIWWRFLRADRTIMPEWRVRQILRAKTPEEFFHNLMLSKAGKFTPMQAKRYGVNFLMMKKSETIEFRHFFATLELSHIRSALEYCREFMNAALHTGEPLPSVMKRNPQWEFPPECLFDVDQERAFRKTKDVAAIEKKTKYVVVGTKVGGGSSVNRKPKL